MEYQSSAELKSGGQPLIGRLVMSTCGNAQVVRRDAGVARTVDGVRGVFLAEDLDSDGASHGVPLLATERIEFVGHPIALVVAESESACRAAEEALVVELHPAPAVGDIEHAQAMGSYFGEAREIARGKVDDAIARAPHRIEGGVSIGSQLPFGRETLCAEAWPWRAAPGGGPAAAGVAVAVVAEAPSRVRAAVAASLDLAESMVQVQSLPISGLSGGKEAEAGWVASLAAFAALKCGRRVRLALTREQDTALAGQRAAAEARFKVGFDDEGRLLAADLDIAIDGGWTLGDAETTRDRVLLHSDGAYHLADFRVSCRICRTNRAVSAAMPAEGAAQGALVMEDIVSRVAHRLGLPAHEVRAKNFYRSEAERVTTHYGQAVEPEPLARTWQRVIRDAEFEKREAEIAKWNAANPCYKRGIGAVPVKLGVGDPRSNRNQTTAVVQLLADGSAVVQLGVAPAGEGLTERVRLQVAASLGVPSRKIAVHRGNLDAVAHSTVAHAVDVAGLVRRAVGAACDDLKARLRQVAVQLFAAGGGGELDEDTIRFREELLIVGSRSLPLAEVVQTAWRRRVSLSAIGHHRTPKLWWDPEVGGGWPFEYFACGAAVVEVQLDAFTGEVQVLRADLALDLGGSRVPEVDTAQATRAFQMGIGWQLQESLRTDGEGRLLNDRGESYTIPGFADAAIDFRLHGIDDHTVGPGALEEGRMQTAAESPVVLAIAAREAVRSAIRAFGAGKDVEVELSVPATPEAVLGALRDLSKRIAAANREAASAKAEAAAKAAEVAADGKEAKSSPKPEPEPKPKAEAKPETASDVKPDPAEKRESKAESRPDSADDPKRDPGSRDKPEAETEAEPSPKGGKSGSAETEPAAEKKSDAATDDVATRPTPSVEPVTKSADEPAMPEKAEPTKPATVDLADLKKQDAAGELKDESAAIRKLIEGQAADDKRD